MRRIELGAKTLALILAVCAGTVSSAQPKDPPAWWGTNDGLTSIFSWKFQPNDPDPRKLSLEHGVIAPWGVPDWTFGGDSPPEWYDEWKGGNPNGDVIEPNRGVYGVGTSLTGSIELNIHNAPDPRRIKYVLGSVRPVPGQAERGESRQGDPHSAGRGRQARDHPKRSSRYQRGHPPAQRRQVGVATDVDPVQDRPSARSRVPALRLRGPRHRSRDRQPPRGDALRSGADDVARDGDGPPGACAP